MNFLKKAIFGAAAAIALVGSAAANNIGGVMWDPDSPNDFSGTSATLTQSINPVTGELSGFGVITTLNGTGVSTFCPGCELTIQYSGYTPIGSTILPDPSNPGQQISYKGGVIKIFVDRTPDASPNDPLLLTSANTGDGDLWLTLAGHAINGVTLVGNNFFPDFLLGKGLWDVTGGLAAYFLDTDTKTDGADFSFTNSFSSFPTGSVLFATGTGNFNGNSIPEPGSMALVGLGLLAAGALRRRNAAK